MLGYAADSPALTVNTPPSRLGAKNSNSMSLKSVQRLRDAVNILYGTAKTKKLYVADLEQYFNFKLNFITLTLPSLQRHTDKVIHNKIFKKFIERWKRRNSNLLYIYKAEVQDNGNLHYHVTTNSFIHHSRLRKWWNNACNTLGYVDNSSSKDPNSTDVHAVKNVKNFAAYMCTYFSKKDIYTKKLKRFHRIYYKKLKNLKSNYYKLPKNYFKQIKRKVEIKVWDASNMLLIKPMRMMGNTPQTRCAYLEIIKKNKVIYYDYVSVMYIDIFKIPRTNYIRVCYEKYLQHVITHTAGATHLLN